MSHEQKKKTNLALLKKRAQFLADIRAYFQKEDVLEVQTPVLAPDTVTDPHTESFPVAVDAISESSLYFLQTSPEYAMKRLLASGSGSIYQIGSAFRYEVAGRWHQPEFTMLEWYRVGFDDKQLMADVARLLKALSFNAEPVTYSYQSVFLDHTSLDPLIVSAETCQAWLRDKQANVSDAVLALDRDELIQYLFATYVEVEFDPEIPTFVCDFPATQAALARLDNSNPKIAKRFELYVDGLECANGFYELLDAKEQQKRFERDQALRAKRGLPHRDIDPVFMDALKKGLPECSGVALGVDRLLAASLKAQRLSDVMSLSWF